MIKDRADYPHAQGLISEYLWARIGLDTMLAAAKEADAILRAAIAEIERVQAYRKETE